MTLDDPRENRTAAKGSHTVNPRNRTTAHRQPAPLGSGQLAELRPNGPDPYRFVNPAKRSASSADRPAPENPADGLPHRQRAVPQRTGRAGSWPPADRPVAGEPVPVGCHVFLVPVEPPPAPRRTRRAALPPSAHRAGSQPALCGPGAPTVFFQLGPSSR